jgi:hypothetical protein
MKAYCQLTDTVIRTILLSSEENLNTSKSILMDIMNRKLYKYVAQTQGKVSVVEIQLYYKILNLNIKKREKNIENGAVNFYVQKY